MNSERVPITGIIHGRKISQITFFVIVCKKTFAIQAISYIKIPAKIKMARKHLQMLPDSRTFSSADNSHYTAPTFSKLQKTLCSISTNRLLDTSNKNLGFKFSGAVNIRTTVIIVSSKL